MTPWMRRALWVGIVFLMGFNLGRMGWYAWTVTAVFAAILVGAIFSVLMLVGLAEKRFKGKTDAAVNITGPTGGSAQVPVKFCPKCGVRLASGAFAHVESCHGSAA